MQERVCHLSHIRLQSEWCWLTESPFMTMPEVFTSFIGAGGSFPLCSEHLCLQEIFRKFGGKTFLKHDTHHPSRANCVGQRDLVPKTQSVVQSHDPSRHKHGGSVTPICPSRCQGVVSGLAEDPLHFKVSVHAPGWGCRFPGLWSCTLRCQPYAA